MGPPNEALSGNVSGRSLIFGVVSVVTVDTYEPAGLHWNGYSLHLALCVYHTGYTDEKPVKFQIERPQLKWRDLIMLSL